ncbi:MPT63 family protein [Mycobacterium sp. 852014-52144_SCH5372336]|uniref:MPT63 family protein n=1 Tax=Mycobacterium sp. 852014-52144_SCH5372336 TaxID=1834115 RepID=UPI0007FBA7D6|nr:MPT63 family protein [Mycobacterium sp. 852014-52144_SCH5372336]OBB73325.1 phosphopeptide-binding protein [Mycobacterium sp. 852014-52144_SCH5372336]
MKITKFSSMLAATATAGFIAAPIVSAQPEPEATPTGPTVQTQALGSQGKLVDGAVIQGWTLTNLKPSSDVIPFPVRGTLWEATATDQAIQGSATPIVSNLNARAADGQTYRALFEVATPQGVNPSTLAPGQETSGKVYFDVTGASPDSVVYNAGGRDLLVWTQSASNTSTSSPSTSYGTDSSPAAAEAQVTEAPEGTTAAPAATSTEAPEGTQATPLAEGSQGTPLPEGSHGTPVEPAEGAPAQQPAQGAPAQQPAQGAPAGTTEGVPQPAGSQGTPLPAGDQVQTPTTYTPVPTP